MPTRRLLVRKIPGDSTTQVRTGPVPPRGSPKPASSVRARFHAICRGRLGTGWAGRCRPTWTTRRSRPGCFAARRQCPTEPDPTARTSTASSSATGSRCSCSGRSTSQVHPGGYRYTQFCEIYRQWSRRLRPSMRQVHRAGEKTFVDFSGKRPTLVDRRTGELRPVELFVAALGASSLTYAEATATQQLADWVTAHIHMVEYCGGATTLWIPDQLKSAITRPCPLRARRQPHLRGPGRPLRRRRHPGAPQKAPRQGGRRDQRTRGPAVDPGPAPRPDLLRARRAEPGDPRPARRAQRPPDEEAGRQPPRPL